MFKTLYLYFLDTPHSKTSSKLHFFNIYRITTKTIRIASVLIFRTRITYIWSRWVSNLLMTLTRDTHLMQQFIYYYK